MLLLDEAASALDKESEILVQKGLNTAMAGRSTLIIAHRLATVQKAGRIGVMEHGRIVETGTPEDLRKQSGLYARLSDCNLKFETLDANCSDAAEHELSGIYLHAFENIMRLEDQGFIQA